MGPGRRARRARSEGGDWAGWSSRTREPASVNRTRGQIGPEHSRNSSAQPDHPFRFALTSVPFLTDHCEVHLTVPHHTHPSDNSCGGPHITSPARPTRCGRQRTLGSTFRCLQRHSLLVHALIDRRVGRDFCVTHHKGASCARGRLQHCRGVLEFQRRSILINVVPLPSADLWRREEIRPPACLA
jgi:hypothetical protein